jgi:hypothetical protein
MFRLFIFLKSVAIIMIMIATMGILANCSSGFQTIMPQPPTKYEKLGHASGSAAGSMLWLPTFLYFDFDFVPIMLNSRVERAYANAVESVPGATGLIDVTIQESWYWWLLGTSRVVSIEGEAIKEVK